MKIVTLEDNILPDTPNAPSVASIMGQPMHQPNNTGVPTVLYMMRPSTSGRCGCGACPRCHAQSQWGAPQAPPTINVNVSPTITAHGGNAYSEGSAPAMAEAPYQQATKPVFIDRVHEVVNTVMKPLYIPVREIVERIKQQPFFMPFQTKTPVDRPVPVPLKVQEPVDRNVPVPVKVVQPVDRPVPLPVNPIVAPVATTRPPQPFQTVTNKRDQNVGVNYFS